MDSVSKPTNLCKRFFPLFLELFVGMAFCLVVYIRVIYNINVNVLGLGLGENSTVEHSEKARSEFMNL